MTPKEKAFELLNKHNFSIEIALLYIDVIYNTLIKIKHDSLKLAKMPLLNCEELLNKDILFYRKVKQEIKKL